MCPEGPEGVAYARFILVSSGPSLLSANNAAGRLSCGKKEASKFIIHVRRV
jgi:hypothetical protein